MVLPGPEWFCQDHHGFAKTIAVLSGAQWFWQDYFGHGKINAGPGKIIWFWQGRALLIAERVGPDRTTSSRVGLEWVGLGITSPVCGLWTVDANDEWYHTISYHIIIRLFYG